MGVVYRAQDLSLSRSVALKFLPPSVSEDADALARFLHEAHAISALNHPNIATIYSLEESESEKFIALEFIDGGTLKDRLKEGPLPIDSAIFFATQIAEGLVHAHAKGIIHRDIKTENIMITGEGRIKITDFGLAKLLGGSTLTRSGATLGTAAYMSPEQARGEEVDHRSDLFSFGIVLYEMLTACLPFKGVHEAALLYEIVNESPKRLNSIRTDIPVELERIVERLM